ncbi:MBL fold metallo-hydrolase [Compostibacter hankyongensis]|uniref:MBL fold metallo-hydrolase n=1 Tax=Compostibacter hankyongensis TaxID=1007089 RepID=A0ABP8FGA3_9BACT
MQVYPIDTELFKLDGGAMFGVVPKVLWSKLHPADENNRCTWAMRCLLIEDGNRLILVDTGIGDKQDKKFLSHYHLHGPDTLDSSLARHGFHRNDITDVFLTHLHFDHCGGAVIRKGDKLLPAFPHAVYWSNARHWQWATEPNAREKASFLKENILPIRESGQLRFLEIDEGTAFTPDISVRFVNGHTESQMLPQLRLGDKTLVFVADLLPSVHHLPLPYVMAYDMFPLTTLREKEQFLTEAAEKEYILFFEHDPAVECCTVKMTEKGVRVAETFSLHEI